MKKKIKEAYKLLGKAIDEVEKKPKWIKITQELRDVTKNRIYKVIDWLNVGPRIYNDKKDIHTIGKNLYQPATKAEIAAAKLGFFMGDDVLFKGLEKEIQFPGFKFVNEKGLCAHISGYGYIPLEHLVKTKTPIFQIGGVAMFDGDEYWQIDKSENWKLHKLKVNISSGLFVNNCIDWKRFVSKQIALEHILSEAKIRFKGKSFKHLEIGDKFKSGEICVSLSKICIHNIIIWDEKKGWAAEPIKPLMLGDEIVIIERVKYTKYYLIKAKGESVTKKEWMEWYNIFMPNVKKDYNIELDLGKFKTSHLEDCEGDFFIKIGCIKNITIKQIESITNHLRKLY